jgi:hypothetical protein
MVPNSLLPISTPNITIMGVDIDVRYMASYYFGEIVVVHRKGYLTHSLSPGTSRNETAVIGGIGNLLNKSWIVQRLKTELLLPWNVIMTILCLYAWMIRLTR